jgi:predicted signal transduction protein with EAL and GGDEF domain
MADADLALYQAKENPGGGAAIFELKMEAPRRRRAEIERALQLPGVQDRLRVMFQPIFDLKAGRIIANEALARWSDPELGAISPSEFVPIAEQLNLIDDINCHLMSLAFEAAHSWPNDIRLSFNLSAIQLCSAGAAKSVLGALKRARLPAGRLQIEVTETALLADFERARANLTELRKAGATIVLDDFGAGFASIGYLRELSFDQIKLDGALVTAAQHSGDGKRLLRAVVGLCEILGVSTVAEHVESEELLKLVMELGCTAAQGFWLERPLEQDDVLHLCGSKVIPLPTRSKRAA